FPVAQTMLEQALWVFEAERRLHQGVRASSYKLITKLLALVGPSMTEENVRVLIPVVYASCQDLLPTSQASKEKSKANQGSTNADAFLKPGSKGGHQGVVGF